MTHFVRQVLFEFFTLGPSFTWGWVRAFFYLQIHVIAGAFETFAVIVLGLGFLCRVVSKKLSNIIILIGIVTFCFCYYASSLLTFPYAHDDTATVNALGSQLLKRDQVMADLAQRYGGKTSIFLSAPASGAGHRYVALNRLGCAGSIPENLAAKIVGDLNAVFPIVASGRTGKAVAEGNVFELGVAPIVGHNPVIASAPNEHYFSLTAEPGHLLLGTANHGVVRDASGDLWLFQYGAGANGELDVKQLENYIIAEILWRQMASGVSEAYGAAPECSGPAGGQGQPKPSKGPGVSRSASGSLIVTISTPDVVTAGAQWRVDQGHWQRSGTSRSGLTIGSHVVEFRPIPGWTTPTDQTITVGNAATSAVSVQYAK